MDLEPTEAAAGLLRLYVRLKFEVTGVRYRGPDAINPTRSRWFGVFKKLYKELMDRHIDAETYIKWALSHDKSKHKSPNILISVWRFEAFAKHQRKAQAERVVDGVDYQTQLGQAKADMDVAVDRWLEKKKFYPDYAAFLRGEYPSLPELYLATDSEFARLLANPQGLLADKVAGVQRWTAFLTSHRTFAVEVGKLRDAAIRLATAS